MANGPQKAHSNIIELISDVSERTFTLVREEIELVKAEVSAKVGKILRGSVVESVVPNGSGFVWTRKQAPVAVKGVIRFNSTTYSVDDLAIIDDTAGYHPRQTNWSWSAGIGEAENGATVAWNLVEGINDPPHRSERTLWIDGKPQEVPPVKFASDLSEVVFDQGQKLSFAAEAERTGVHNFALIRSNYRQPFGKFNGTLPGNITLREAYGVMEKHHALW